MAGEGKADQIVEGLSIDAMAPPSPTELSDALSPADLVVVENLCSLPLNPPASHALTQTLAGRPAILHHHDLPWQRARFSHFPPPPDDPAWAHVTINELSRRQLAHRGIDAVTIYNAFDAPPPKVSKEAARASLGLDPAALIVLQPTRAIGRKNIPAALSIANFLGATYWLLGPAEEGYGPKVEELLSKAEVPVIWGSPQGRALAPELDPPRIRNPDLLISTAVETRALAPELDKPRSPTQAVGLRYVAAHMPIAEAYSACDVVAFPSLWEGFGNPTIESALYRRPLAVGNYPVAEELRRFGFIWFDAKDHRALRDWLIQRDPKLLDHNEALARRHFSFADLPAKLARVLDKVLGGFG